MTRKRRLIRKRPRIEYSWHKSDAATPLDTAMGTVGQIFQDAIGSIYSPALMSFAIATSLIALIICILDWIGTLLLGRSSLLGVGFGSWRTLQSILLWGLGAGLGAYLGGLVKLFDIESINARVIVGLGWPTVLPRLLAMVAETEREEEQNEEEETL